MRAPFSLLALGLVLLGGCLSHASPATPPGPAVAPATLSDGRVAVDVAVPVLLVGFGPDVADALRAAPGQVADGEAVAATFTPELADVAADPNSAKAALYGTNDGHPAPVLPTGRYQVTAADEAFVQAFVADAQAHAVSPGLLDGDAAEAWLLAHGPAAGFAPTRDTPGLVLVDAAALGDHAYRYAYQHGWIDGVRTFGGRAPLLVMDLGAREDAAGDQSYSKPLPPSGEATAAAALDAAADAVRFRLLQGPLFEPATAPCHALTLLLAIRDTAVSDLLSGVPAEDLVHADAIRSAFANLTGSPNVFTDLRVLHLPQDDPALDAATRASGWSHPGAVMAWANATAQSAWVPHAGCQAYLDVVLLGDAADDGGGQVPSSMVGDGGQGFVLASGQRVAYSVLGDSNRLRHAGDPDDPSDPVREGMDFQFAHEGGHLFGLPHPHGVILPDGSYAANGHFTATWSVMGYRVGSRVLDFDAFDQANFRRGLAGRLLADAAAGGQDQAKVDAALQAMGAGDWDGAARALR